MMGNTDDGQLGCRLQWGVLKKYVLLECPPLTVESEFTSQGHFTH